MRKPRRITYGVWVGFTVGSAPNELLCASLLESAEPFGFALCDLSLTKTKAFSSCVYPLRIGDRHHDQGAFKRCTHITMLGHVAPDMKNAIDHLGVRNRHELSVYDERLTLLWLL